MQTRYGGGHHIAYVSFQSAIVSLKYAFAQKILYRLALGVTKLSICLSYLRFFTDRTSRYTTYAIGIVIVLYTTPLLFIAIFECVPVSNSWKPTKLHECRSADGGTIATAVLNSILDLVMIAFAVPRMSKSFLCQNFVCPSS